MAQTLSAPIVTHLEFVQLRDILEPTLGTIVATSGGYDPIHPGHISCIFESKKLGDTLVVIVNGDDFLTRKKGRAFLPLAARAKIVSSIVGVDYVVTLDIENDLTVTQALETVRPHIFAKGGDRIAGHSIPSSEENFCEENSIKIIDGVGEPKKWSSSETLKKWVQFERV